MRTYKKIEPNRISYMQEDNNNSYNSLFRDNSERKMWETLFWPKIEPFRLLIWCTCSSTVIAWNRRVFAIWIKHPVQYRMFLCDLLTFQGMIPPRNFMKRSSYKRMSKPALTFLNGHIISCLEKNYATETRVKSALMENN